MREAQVAGRLLAWYDRHARVLPWRIAPGSAVPPDPYRIWLSEVMLQQTTVAAVRGHFARFLTRWPTVQALAAAPEAEVMAEWAGLGYYARARNLLACARHVAAGGFPDTAAELARLPGIGAYTSAAIAAIAFGRAEPVLDGNVERVMARLLAEEVPLPQARPALRAALARLVPDQRPGDFAQAMMDLGATICTVRAPGCELCPLAALCEGRARGIAASLPRRLPRPVRPLRRGILYLARRSDGAWLLERRPPRGLLGGMLGFPGSDWVEGVPQETPPLAAAWRDPELELRHSFTHFHLRLSLRLAEVPQGANPERGWFLPAAEFAPSALPTLMRKAHALARKASLPAPGTAPSDG